MGIARFMAGSLTRLLVLVASLAGLAACEVGPDYHTPTVEIPAGYKEASYQDGIGWKPGEPQQAGSAAAWWQAFNDPVLDGLERQIDISNQNLKASEAAYRAAHALVTEARAGYYPTVGISGSAQRIGSGGGGGGTVIGGTSISGGGGGASQRTQIDLSLGVSWVPDIWGKVRRAVESSAASAQVSAADLASVRLSAQGALATDYFELRIADQQERLLDATVEAFARSLQITRNQYNAGTVAKSDVVQAVAQLESTRALAINVGVLRSQLEHAVAVLIGRPPAEFSLPPEPLTLRLPEIPTGLPSTLLQRRPDIAAVERQMAAANAQIGIAIGNYYPNLTLSASYGVAGMALGLLSASNAVWAVGPALSETVFEGGLRAAQVENARATYDQTVANYRQTVLTGFQQVEDELAALAILARQAEVQEAALRASQQAVDLLLNQYRAGTVAYTSVVTAQATELSDAETALSLLQGRVLASVTLIEALGGGWDAAELPKE
jgi:NodT family efflux transporter outer membrane factor (OMF) lipoprotein